MNGITLGICAYNNLELLEWTINSLWKNTKRPCFGSTVTPLQNSVYPPGPGTSLRYQIKVKTLTTLLQGSAKKSVCQLKYSPGRVLCMLYPVSSKGPFQSPKCRENVAGPAWHTLYCRYVRTLRLAEDSCEQEHGYIGLSRGRYY